MVYQTETKIQHTQENQTPQLDSLLKKEKNTVREGGREKRKGETETVKTQRQSSYQAQEPTHAVPILTAERCCLLVDMELAKFIILNMSDFQSEVINVFTRLPMIFSVDFPFHSHSSQSRFPP